MLSKWDFVQKHFKTSDKSKDFASIDSNFVIILFKKAQLTKTFEIMTLISVGKKYPKYHSMYVFNCNSTKTKTKKE